MYSREVGHRVKSISASKFSGPEVTALQYGGNQVARSIWLSTYRGVNNSGEPENDGDVRLFMRQKYYEQKWLDRKKGIEHAENVKKMIKELYLEDGTRKPGATSKRQSVNVGNSRPKIVPTQSWVDDNVPIGLIPAVQQQQQQQQQRVENDLLLSEDFILPSPSPTAATTSQQFSSIPQPTCSNTGK